MSLGVEHLDGDREELRNRRLQRHVVGLLFSSSLCGAHGTALVTQSAGMQAVSEPKCKKKKLDGHNTRATLFSCYAVTHFSKRLGLISRVTHAVSQQFAPFISSAVLYNYL